jgi:acyl-[acyl-carrier-protein] desaturase
MDHVTLSKVEVIADLENVVGELMAVHEAKRLLWFPSEILAPAAGVDPDRHRVELRDRAGGLDESVRVALALNMLTEEGLPHFHRLLATHLDANPYWSSWTNLWTAEEDRHGAILHDYVHESGVLDTLVLERMQFDYLRAGFAPEWDLDPYRVFVYTSLQERATQVSHAATGKLAATVEPTIGIVLEKVAQEEARHYAFYRTIFKEVLARDPNRALEAAARVMPGIDMPGVSMPNFREFADVVRRAGIYGPRDYLQIVEEQIRFWGIANLTDLDATGSAAQDRIMAIPERLQRLANLVERKARPRTYSFDVVFNREFAVG